MLTVVTILWFICGYLGSTPECFTLKEATEFVKDNYAIVNLDYADFNEANFAKEEAVSLPTIVGAVGTSMHFVLRESETVDETPRGAGGMMRGRERDRTRVSTGVRSRVSSLGKSIAIRAVS